jgi:hypothetical protein
MEHPDASGLLRGLEPTSSPDGRRLYAMQKGGPVMRGRAARECVVPPSAMHVAHILCAQQRRNDLRSQGAQYFILRG